MSYRLHLLTSIASIFLLSAPAFAQKNKLEIKVGSHCVMQQGDFGLSTNQRTWNANARVVAVSKKQKITEDYTMLIGKRSHCHNEGVEQTFSLVNAQNDTLLVVLRNYKDGVAFRYVLPQIRKDEELMQEFTAYRLPLGANRWMQEYDRQGYEHFFPLNNTGISPESARINQWGYPALAQMDANNYMLISESDIARNQCGSWISNSMQNLNKYTITLPEDHLRLTPQADGTWKSPWRVLIIGSLNTVVESTLITDVATPCQLEDTSWIKTGLSSWIYWAYNHGSQDYKILCEYVDLAANMGWPYTLIDAEWDVMSNGGNLEDVINYAKQKGVRPMIWYNSTTNWIDGAPTPQYRLNKPKDRENEYKTIANMGVTGVKIDFFAGDKAETNNYYLDLMQDAAKHHLLVNFHGATVPRGWSRTYPNLISMEAVYGAEWYNNRNVLTTKAACHNATLPFTRNVIGPMDYTPGTFTDSQHPHITTHAHELALTILFESGIQHMPDRPSAYYNLPEAVKELLKTLPSTWDDTKLLAGYPGKSVVLARQKGDTWYIAGINGTDEEMDIAFNLKSLRNAAKKGILIMDGAQQTSFDIKNYTFSKQNSIHCMPRGGFVIELKIKN